MFNPVRDPTSGPHHKLGWGRGKSDPTQDPRIDLVLRRCAAMPARPAGFARAFGSDCVCTCSIYNEQVLLINRENSNSHMS